MDLVADPTQTKVSVNITVTGADLVQDSSLPGVFAPRRLSIVYSRYGDRPWTYSWTLQGPTVTAGGRAAGWGTLHGAHDNVPGGPLWVLDLVKDVEVHSRQLVWITLEPSPALYVHAHGHTIWPDRLHLAYVRINGAWSCDVWTIMGHRPNALVQRRVTADIHSLEGVTPEWVKTLIAEHTPTLTEA